MTTIYLDMDGVIADWMSAAMKIYDCTLEDYEAERPSFPWKYAVHEWISELIGSEVTNEQLWAEICSDKNFWKNVPLYPWSKSLVEFLQLTGSELYIASYTGWDSSASKGKIDWMCKHFPHFDYQRMIFIKDKHLLAKPNCLLIDDHSQNAMNFFSYGGYGLEFPQPWNGSSTLIGKRMENTRSIIQKFISDTLVNELMQKG